MEAKEKEISEGQKAALNATLGLLFSLNTTIEYAEVFAGIIAGGKSKYNIKKTNDVIKDCSLMKGVIDRSVNRMDEESRQRIERAAERNKDFVFEIFTLDEEDQLRVLGLIKKIKRAKYDTR